MANAMTATVVPQAHGALSLPAKSSMSNAKSPGSWISSLYATRDVRDRGCVELPVFKIARQLARAALPPGVRTLSIGDYGRSGLGVCARILARTSAVGG